jgi:protease-4
MATWLLDTVDQEFVDTLAAGRNLTPAEIRGIIARAPASGPELVEAGVVDGVKSYDEVLAELGDGEAPPIVDERDYSTVSLKSLGLAGGARIAVIHAAGGIVTGHGRPGREEVASRDVAEALRSAASDEIWLAAREAGAAKPLVASMADVAASGGYYIASAADRIVAQPTTITGSIGVVLFKPYVTDLLDEVGVHTESITRGRFARYMDLTKRFDDEELALVRRQMNDIYELFVTRVSTGRGLDTQAVDRIGGGRVWTGSQALERGLVDELGGIRRAIALAAEAADVGAPDKVELVHYPKAGGIVEEILAAGAHVAAQRPAIEILEPVTRMLTAWVPPVGISTSMAVVPEMR